MSGPTDRSRNYETDVARDLRARLRGLDPFIPPAPPFEQIERPGAVAGSPRRSSGGRTLPVRGLPVGMAAAAVAFVLVLASGFWGPRGGPGVSVSPSPTAAQSAVVSSTPTAASTATEAPTPTLPPGVIFKGSVQYVAWSPGGTEIAVTVGGSGDKPFVEILAVDGREIDKVDAWYFAWIDDETYVAVDWGQGLPVDNFGRAFVGHVGDGARQEIPGDFTDLVSGAGGSVALNLNETGSNHYKIWGPSGLSEPRDGVPMAFSPGGSMLAVVHYPVACCAGAPSPEPTRAPGPPTLDIVSTETGESLAKAPIEWAYGAILAFSPSGLRVAFAMYPEASGSRERVGILDIPTQELSIVDPSPDDITAFDSLVWTDAGHLSIRSWTGGSIPVDVPVSVSFGPDDGSTIAVSSRGATAIGPKDTDEVTITGAVSAGPCPCRMPLST